MPLYVHVCYMASIYVHERCQRSLLNAVDNKHLRLDEETHA
jgi:hypothetical protein